MNARCVIAPKLPRKMHQHATEREIWYAERVNAKMDGRV